MNLSARKLREKVPAKLVCAFGYCIAHDEMSVAFLSMLFRKEVVGHLKAHATQADKGSALGPQGNTSQRVQETKRLHVE